MRLALLYLAILLAPALFLTGAALGATPEPPRRPVKNVKPPAQEAPAPAPAPQPVAPAPAAQPAPAPQRQPVDIDPEKLQPYNLPPASRQRVRLCGERWRDLKQEGMSAGLTWRSFAEKCLPGQD